MLFRKNQPLMARMKAKGPKRRGRKTLTIGRARVNKLRNKYKRK